MEELSILEVAIVVAGFMLETKSNLKGNQCRQKNHILLREKINSSVLLACILKGKQGENVLFSLPHTDFLISTY